MNGYQPLPQRLHSPYQLSLLALLAADSTTRTIVPSTQAAFAAAEQQNRSDEMLESLLGSGSDRDLNRLSIAGTNHGMNHGTGGAFLSSPKSRQATPHSLNSLSASSSTISGPLVITAPASTALPTGTAVMTSSTEDQLNFWWLSSSVPPPDRRCQWTLTGPITSLLSLSISETQLLLVILLNLLDIQSLLSFTRCNRRLRMVASSLSSLRIRRRRVTVVNEFRWYSKNFLRIRPSTVAQWRRLVLRQYRLASSLDRLEDRLNICDMAISSIRDGHDPTDWNLDISQRLTRCAGKHCRILVRDHGNDVSWCTRCSRRQRQLQRQFEQRFTTSLPSLPLDNWKLPIPHILTAARWPSSVSDLDTVLESYLDADGSNNVMDDDGRWHSLAHLILAGGMDGLSETQLKFVNQVVRDETAILDGGVDVWQDWDSDDLFVYASASILQCLYFTGDSSSSLFSYLLHHPRVDLNHRCTETAAAAAEGIVKHFSTDVRTSWAQGREYYRSYHESYSLEDATLLHFAVADGCLETVQQLLHPSVRGRVDVNARAKLFLNKHLSENEEAWINGIDYEHLQSDDFSVNLWHCRDTVRTRRICGVTPLHLAARLGNSRMLVYLLQHGADHRLMDADYNTPLDYLRFTTVEFQLDDPTDKHMYKTGFAFVYGRHTSLPGMIRCESVLMEVEAGIRRSIDAPDLIHGRIILGDGNFTFSESLVRKAMERGIHKQLLPMISTEFDTFEHLSSNHKDLKDRISFLKQQGVQVRFEVDARYLNKDQLRSYLDQADLPSSFRFSRIHFNCPRVGGHLERLPTVDLLHDFFRAVRDVQQPGDLVYVVLPHHADEQKQRQFLGYIYSIYNSARQNGYVLWECRPFNEVRFPGYRHAITGKSKSASVAEALVEWVAVRTNLTPDEILVHPRFAPSSETFINERDPKSRIMRMPQPLTIIRQESVDKREQLDLL